MCVCLFRLWATTCQVFRFCVRLCVFSVLLAWLSRCFVNNLSRCLGRGVLCASVCMFCSKMFRLRQDVSLGFQDVSFRL